MFSVLLKPRAANGEHEVCVSTSESVVYKSRLVVSFRLAYQAMTVAMQILIAITGLLMRRIQGLLFLMGYEDCVSVLLRRTGSRQT